MAADKGNTDLLDRRFLAVTVCDIGWESGKALHERRSAGQDLSTSNTHWPTVQTLKQHREKGTVQQ